MLAINWHMHLDLPSTQALVARLPARPPSIGRDEFSMLASADLRHVPLPGFDGPGLAGSVMSRAARFVAGDAAIPGRLDVVASGGAYDIMTQGGAYAVTMPPQGSTGSTVVASKRMIADLDHGVALLRRGEPFESWSTTDQLRFLMANTAAVHEASHASRATDLVDTRPERTLEEPFTEFVTHARIAPFMREVWGIEVPGESVNVFRAWRSSVAPSEYGADVTRLGALLLDAAGGDPSKVQRLAVELTDRTPARQRVGTLAELLPDPPADEMGNHKTKADWVVEEVMGRSHHGVVLR